MNYDDTCVQELNSHELASELEQSQSIFEQYGNGKENPIDFSDIKERFIKAYPKIDFFLSISKVTSNTSIESQIDQHFTGRLNRYLSACNSLGYLGRFGATIDPANQLLNFPSSSISLLWIPKNSCTTLKRELLSKEPVDVSAFVLKRKIHISTKKHFGVNRIEVIREEILPTACVLRDPISRIVSCYLDKFAKPILKNKNYEQFVQDHLKSAQVMHNVTPEETRSISFAEFVNYITSSPRWSLNNHWRPQSDFLPADHSKIVFGTVEDLPSFFKNLGLEYSSKSYNKSFGGRVSPGCNGDLVNTLPADFQNEKIENYGRFLSEPIRDRLERFLAEDIAIYNSIKNRTP